MTTIPLEALSQHLAVIGKTGTGKSFAARGLVEQLLDEGRRVCIVDPTGVWFGLKSNAKGDGPGYPVAIFGGDHADVAITVGAAKALGQIIAERNLPAVIDVSDFNMTERYQFGEAFFRSLHAANRAPLHLILDEADEFARQQPLPEQRRVLHEVDRIVRRGRVRGFRVVFITQRPAVIHKNVLTQANAMIAMRLTSPQDRKAFDEWIKGQADEAQGREVAGSLSSLKRGEGWVWAPELGILDRVTFPPIRTFDSMRAPADGETVAEPVNLADVDLSEIRDAFADAEAEARANDPKALKAEITALKRQLGGQQPQGASAAEIEMAVDAAYQRGYKEGAAEEWKRGSSVVRAEVTVIAQDSQAVSNRLTALVSAIEKISKDAVNSAPVVQPRPVQSIPPKSPPRAKLVAPAANGKGSHLPPGEKAVLIAAAQYGEVERDQLSVLTGYKRLARQALPRRERPRIAAGVVGRDYQRGGELRRGPTQVGQPRRLSRRRAAERTRRQRRKGIAARTQRGGANDASQREGARVPAGLPRRSRRGDSAPQTIARVGGRGH